MMNTLALLQMFSTCMAVLFAMIIYLINWQSYVLLHATASFNKVIHFCITTLFATHLELMFTHTLCLLR